MPKQITFGDFFDAIEGGVSEKNRWQNAEVFLEEFAFSKRGEAMMDLPLEKGLILIFAGAATQHFDQDIAPAPESSDEALIRESAGFFVLLRDKAVKFGIEIPLDVLDPEPVASDL